MKNEVTVKGDIALIHVQRAGQTHFVLMDVEEYEWIDAIYPNKINLDTQGFPQLRIRKNGKSEVIQLHLAVTGFDPDRWKHSFKNGNKLDCRIQNIEVTRR